MAATVPLLVLFHVYQAEIGLMHQRRGLERLTGRFLGQLPRRQLAQRVVDQRQQLFRGARVAVLKGGQDASHVVHRRHQ
jgi:hypothetical protein